MISAQYGPIRQLGYVVEDIHAAMRMWTDKLRVGPWFYKDRLKLERYTFRGVEHTTMDMCYALANSGDMQVELIQQRCDTPSLYSEFLDKHGEGLQHICVWPEDYDTTYALAQESGLVAAQEGQIHSIRFAYFEEVVHGGTSLEMVDRLDIRQAGIDTIRAAAQDWDGSEPVRGRGVAAHAERMALAAARGQG